MDEYRQATSTSNINPAYTGEIGSRYAEQESFYSDERSFTNIEQPSIQSSYTEESGRPPRRYQPPTVQPTYYETSGQVNGVQFDQAPLFNYQPQWMKKVKVDSFSGGNFDNTMEQSYNKNSGKIKTYLPCCIILIVLGIFLPVGIVALSLSLNIRSLRNRGQTTLAKQRSKILFWWILIATTLLMFTYAVFVLVLLFCGFQDYTVDAYYIPKAKSAPYCIFGGGIRETYI